IIKRKITTKAISHQALEKKEWTLLKCLSKSNLPSNLTYIDIKIGINARNLKEVKKANIKSCRDGEKCIVRFVWFCTYRSFLNCLSFSSSASVLEDTAKSTKAFIFSACWTGRV